MNGTESGHMIENDGHSFGGQEFKWLVKSLKKKHISLLSLGSLARVKNVHPVIVLL